MEGSTLAHLSMNDVYDFFVTNPRYAIGAGLSTSAVVLYGLARWYFAGGRCTSTRRLDGKTAIVTGGNAGIGKETARDLAGRGARVIIACRDMVRGDAAAADIRKSTGNGNVVCMACDLASLESVQKFCTEVLKREEAVHILINNAGIMMTDSSVKTAEGYEMQLGVNHLGHFLLTNLLLDRMKQSAPARIINVSSLAYKYAGINFDDINMTEEYDPFLAYGQSKLANVLFTRELAHRLAGSGVTAYSVHPGVVHTNLGRHVGKTMAWWKKAILYPLVLLAFKTASQGAQTSLHCAVQEGLEEDNGQYFSDCEVQDLLPHALDDDDAHRLWEISAHMVRLES